jgi:hypothetical protein
MTIKAKTPDEVRARDAARVEQQGQLKAALAAAKADHRQAVAEQIRARGPLTALDGRAYKKAKAEVFRSLR